MAKHSTTANGHPVSCMFSMLFLHLANVLLFLDALTFPVLHEVNIRPCAFAFRCDLANALDGSKGCTNAPKLVARSFLAHVEAFQRMNQIVIKLLDGAHFDDAHAAFKQVDYSGFARCGYH